MFGLLLAAMGGLIAPLPSPFFELPSGSAQAPYVLADGATRTFRRMELRQVVVDAGTTLALAPDDLADQVVIVRAGAVEAVFDREALPAHARAVIFVRAGGRCELRNAGPFPSVCDEARFQPNPAQAAALAPSAAPSRVIEWASLHPRPFNEGVRWSILDISNGTLAHLRIHATRLNPHALGNPVHRHAWEELTVVLDGAMQALVGSDRRKLEAGSACVELAGGDQTYANPYDAPTTFVMIEAIPPGIPTR